MFFGGATACRWLVLVCWWKRTRSGFNPVTLRSAGCPIRSPWWGVAFRSPLPVVSTPTGKYRIAGRISERGVSPYPAPAAHLFRLVRFSRCASIATTDRRSGGVLLTSAIGGSWFRAFTPSRGRHCWKISSGGWVAGVSLVCWLGCYRDSGIGSSGSWRRICARSGYPQI